ncbi:DUF3560 domain-containing protein [Streptosporangium sp. OZ121]|uniref:DUF3560 domain-containing protein n=1 Tax=Streptosporangium sp. OZ121 TaxID=3444183 RepID=UPI003F7B342C
MITISHSHEEGTLLDGSQKGDGVYEIVKKHGFSFFPSIRAIGIRQSRDRVANRYRINAAAEALRAAGHEVTVEIDDTFRDRADVLADQGDRLDDRRHALARKAEKRGGEADAAFNRADQIAERFAGGQPILVGHHSEGRARRDRDRVDQAMRTGLDKSKEAKEVARRANAVGRSAAYSATPAVTERRIKTAESELRVIQKNLDGYTRRHLDHAGEPYYIEDHKPATGNYREQLLARQAQLNNQLEYDRAQLQAAIDAGDHVSYGPHNVHVGDTIRSWGGARVVQKVNKVTVVVPSGYSWPDKVKFTDIKQVECPHGDEPVTLAAKPRARAAKKHPEVTAPTPAVDLEELKRKAATVLLSVPLRLEAFVSPPDIAELVVDLAHVKPGMTVLEPSAGAGALLRAAAVGLGATVDCVELAPQLVAFLRDSGHARRVLHSDFLTVDRDLLDPAYDRVVMNPPFSDGQDVAHVAYALSFVKPGGYLVAVMSNGVTFRKDKGYPALRDLVEARGGEFITLPDDTFAPSGTNVKTVIAVIPALADA